MSLSASNDNKGSTTWKTNKQLAKAELNALARIKRSASKYVLVKRFGIAARTGLKKARETGLVEIIDTPLGRAYQMKGEEG